MTAAILRRARAASLASLVLAGSLSAQYGGVGPELGSSAPDAELVDLDGNAVRVLDYVVEGTPTLIEFWATWCENCEALQPQIDRLVEAYGERLGVVAVAVAVAQSQRRVRRHVEQHAPGYPFLYDARGAAVRAYEAPTTSVVVLLDASGHVAYTGVGSDQDLIGAVERVMGSPG